MPERAALAAEKLRALQPDWDIWFTCHRISMCAWGIGSVRWNPMRGQFKPMPLIRMLSPEQGFFRTYMAHNHHMHAFAAMMRGQTNAPRTRFERMLKEIPENGLRRTLSWSTECLPCLLKCISDLVDGMRFWPSRKLENACRLLASFAISRSAVALAAKKQPTEARREQAIFIERKQALPDTAMFVQNKASDVMSVAEAMLEGEILYREGKVQESIASLRAAVAT